MILGLVFELGTIALVLAGMVLLTLAAGRAGAVVALARQTTLATTWRRLRGLMIAFAASYLLFVALVLGGSTESVAATTGFILAGGGLFVFMVTRSSQRSLAALAGESLARRHVSDVLNALADGILILGADGRIASANRRMLELAEADAADLIGSAPTAILGLAADAAGRSVGRLREGMLRRRRGPPIAVDVQHVEIQGEDGESTMGLLVVRDRREAVARELQLESAVKAAEEALRARHQLTSVLLSEMRPRFSVLRDALARPALAREADGLEVAREILTGLEVTLSGVVDAERPGGPTQRSIDLAACLQRKCAALSAAAPRVRFEWSIAADVPPRCHGRESSLREVLAGIGHFLVATVEPTDVRISVAQVPGDPERLLFSVASVGSQGEATSAAVSGVGLGLAAARLIVHTLGGKLWLNGDEGAATEVSFTAVLPPADGPHEKGVHTPSEMSPLMLVAAMATRSTPHSLITGAESRGSALVVDDSPPAREVLVRLVRDLGYEVEAVGTGTECVTLATGRAFDLILLDLVLPDISGIEIISTLREHPTSARTAIVVVSSIEETRSVAACLERGADDYLSKPVNPMILRARLHGIHENRMLSRQSGRQVARLEEEIRRADSLLRAILPRAVADELQSTGQVVPRRHADVTVLFADVVGFTAYCDGRRPEDVLVELQALVKEFEALCRDHGVQKIKTVGDAMMACGGLLDTHADATERCVNLGFALIEATARHPAGWDLRVGIHRGPVVAGIIGAQQFSYDIWGDSVNTAQRIEHHGVAGEVCVSDEARRALPSTFSAQSVGVREVKGKGPLEVFVVSRSAEQRGADGRRATG